MKGERWGRGTVARSLTAIYGPHVKQRRYCHNARFRVEGRDEGRADELNFRVEGRVEKVQG